MNRILNFQKDIVVKNAIKIIEALNKHLKEAHCRHTVREIVTEAFADDSESSLNLETGATRISTDSVIPAGKSEYDII